MSVWVQSFRNADGLVCSIYSENSDKEICELSVGSKVPIPIDEEIGSSYDFPNFFSIVFTTPANIFLADFHDTSCWCPSSPLNTYKISCCDLFDHCTTSEDIKNNQLDDTNYSSCANSLTLMAVVRCPSRCR